MRGKTPEELAWARVDDMRQLREHYREILKCIPKGKRRPMSMRVAQLTSAIRRAEQELMDWSPIKKEEPRQ